MRNISDALGLDSTAIVKADVVESIPSASTHIPTNEEFEKNIHEDYEKSRSYLYKLMGKLDGMLDSSVNVAEQTEHPRAFEVSGNLFKIATDITEQLQKLNKDTQILKGLKSNTPTASSVTTNNSIFVGSTSELSAFLNAKNKKHEST